MHARGCVLHAYATFCTPRLITQRHYDEAKKGHKVGRKNLSVFFIFLLFGGYHSAREA